MVAQPKELEWFPCYPDRIFASGKWQAMKDYQRGWYWHLLLLMTRSKPLGYLPLDMRLWALAGACSKQYWDNHSALVLSAFKVEEFDGMRWIYSEPLMKVLNEQTYRRDIRVEKARVASRSTLRVSKSSLIYSLEFQKIWENNTWKAVSKQTAFKAFNKALEVIEKEKQKTRDEAIAFLADAMEEFKNSPAGKEHGLFQDYQPPYPASWLNAQRYFDDRRTWRGAANLVGTATNGNSRAGERKSLVDPQCPTCKGCGFDLSSGKASPCGCRKRNRPSDAQSANGIERCGDERKVPDARGSGRDFKAAGANDR